MIEKLSLDNIRSGSLLTHLNILESDEGIAYEVRVSFTLTNGDIARINIGKHNSETQMDFCVRKATGDYVDRLIYKFPQVLLNKYLNKSFSNHIKYVANKKDYSGEDIIDLINKVRKYYDECTPVLSIA